MNHDNPSEDSPRTAQDWDERYGTASLWSGDPNQSLVAVAAELAPGTVLDVGCGEGADAVWLAEHGWTVAAMDVSRVAVERGRARAEAAGVPVTWLVEGFGERPRGPFDLVSAQYPAIPRHDGTRVEEDFAAAVAPGGRLLFVHHEMDEVPHAAAAQDYVMPQHMVDHLLAAGWEIERDEVRERHVTHGAGSGHARDRVVLARRP
ncbi:class I SAM-dependent methyltransferase [Kocuria rhizophila]|uniref:class I SAM-dependent methyltransferase n=1 Tax=Kocuria rhizophila TaxID=72000 RepID=UPI001EF40FDB|nr:class I SAM-dependent methyltransferase [Kocuria rhizophila]MCG7424113.1 methyltransferase domain-containing protein [Kocuria rhizophila]MCT1880814.1 methyltransferase domain-containing protein [Kocuria rhizophila]MCT2248874.1 methyltransferase domain-containing protein [Kocuria rhizophila]